MKYLSVCSGIEAASVAWEPLGWEPLAFSEIEPFPRAVLQHHYPNTPLHGDFTLLRDKPWIVDADLLCGGTPCQAFSVAGLRQSLADDRGNLTLQFVLLANAIDDLRRANGRAPAWILWENVPGVLSTNDNAFGAFLGGLCGRDTPIPEPEGGWTRAGVVDGPARCAAWRTLDAQHFGVAQRRQRVFVLALGGAGRWAAADALLPIIESGRWHPAPRRGKGEGVAVATAEGVGGGVEGVDYENNPVYAGQPMGPLMKGSPTGGGRPLPVVMAHGQANAEVVSDDKKWPADIASTLNAAFGDKLGLEDQHALNGAPLFVPASAAILVRMRESKEGGGKGPLVSEDQSPDMANYRVLAFRDPSPTITSKMQGASGWAPYNEDAHLVGVQPTSNDQVLAQPVAFPINTLTLGGRPDPVNDARMTLGVGSDGDPQFTLQAAHSHAVATAMQVRRLTPVECERLQGFPIVRNMAYIATWFDRQKSVVRVELKCRREQANACHADASGLILFATTAAKHFRTSHPVRDQLVLVSARTHYEEEQVALHKIPKSSWSVMNAEKVKWCRQPILTESTAHGIVALLHELVNAVIAGRVVSQASIISSILRENGNWCVEMSIDANKGFASDAESGQREGILTFITSALGANAQKDDLTLQTLLCSVLTAIDGFTPSETPAESFSAAIEGYCEYTRIPWRGKPADQCPDGPRYKALGNSWAVPCARYIGERIQQVTKS